MSRLIRPPTQWPAKEPGFKKLEKAAQIQYFFKEEDDGMVNTYAINLLNPMLPYEWYNIPSYHQRFLHIILWLQQVCGYLFWLKMPRNKLNKSYIIDMETIVETFWAVLNANQVDNWLQEVETPWCVIQKNTSFHSEMVLEMAIRKGDLDIKELAVQITDWDSEADLLVNIGFLGSTQFDDKPG
ncbi:hypothetical protein L208DRAFT_1378108 [Tricholoma matsutake]|nr:hypothetical protein L208DRAFT_1378108 [Tricholoma matsutake 945]